MARMQAEMEAYDALQTAEAEETARIAAEQAKTQAEAAATEA